MRYIIKTKGVHSPTRTWHAQHSRTPPQTHGRLAFPSVSLRQVLLCAGDRNDSLAEFAAGSGAVLHTRGARALCQARRLGPKIYVIGIMHSVLFNRDISTWITETPLVIGVCCTRVNTIMDMVRYLQNPTALARGQLIAFVPLQTRSTF
jgi:hypothetical protein